MTRRGLVVPVLATVATAACAPLAGPASQTLGPAGWQTARAAYGPDPRQRVHIHRPSQAHDLPMLLVLTHAPPTAADQASAKTLADGGMVVVVVQRRPSPVPVFPAYISDVASALAWSVEHWTELGASPHLIGILGEGDGARAGLMLARDPRYLSSVGMTGRLKAVAAMDAPGQVDPTLTDPSAYAGPQSGVAIWRGSSDAALQAVDFLKHHMN